MDKYQKLRNDMAEKGVECTPSEVKKLYRFAKKVREMSLLPEKELRQIFDLKDKAHKMFFNAVMRLKSQTNS